MLIASESINNINDVTSNTVEAAGNTVEAAVTQVQSQVNQELSFFEKFFTDIESDIISLIFKVFFAIVVLIIGMIIIHFVRKAIRKWLDKIAVKNGIEHIDFIDSLIKIILYSLLAILIAQYFGVSAASVVAILGSFGLTIGLAFQGALSNFAGGVLILMQKPFYIGDYIVVGSPACEGNVVKIGIIYTTVNYAGQRTIVIPNGALANTTISNLTRDNLRFLDITVGISYSSDIALAKSILLDLANAEEAVLKDQLMRVFVKELSASSVDIGLHTYVTPSEYFSVKCRLLENIKLAFDANGISIPFNQLDVHIDKNN